MSPGKAWLLRFGVLRFFAAWRTGEPGAIPITRRNEFGRAFSDIADDIPRLARILVPARPR